MHSGLPSLIDSVFGKQDLASVSLEEIREVIAEFPSFNAAHYILSVKLKLEKDSDFEQESMRTALYFNNALWLNEILEERNPAFVDSDAAQSTINGYESAHETFNEPQAFSHADQFESINDSIVELISVESIAEPKNDENENELKEKDIPPNGKSVGETDETTESAFDLIIKKWTVQTESIAESGGEVAEVMQATEIREEVAEVMQETEIREEVAEVMQETEIWEETEIETAGESEEYVSEYGIFEEKPIILRDHDQEAFDRPVDFVQKQESAKEETVNENKTEEITPFTNMDLVEQIMEKDVDKDLEAFDRPLDQGTFLPVEMELNEDADDTEIGDDQIQEVITRFGEQYKPMAPFDAKKAEAIVFAPYHMIDYFASQGIKLVLEDQPADSFGKQLKSFTDWLKVMKKLPLQTNTEKSDEKEAERIRHFAAHSIEERDILTETMAEVLAKQGMYDHAIALYQKLSLIYPPKSAYFASRIEQLKASLP